MHCLFCPRFPCLGSPCTGSDHKVSTPLHRSSICDGSPVHMHALCSVSAWFPYNDDCLTRLYTQRVLISYLCKLSESVAILTTVERISIRIFFFAVRNSLFFFYCGLRITIIILIIVIHYRLFCFLPLDVSGHQLT